MIAVSFGHMYFAILFTAGLVIDVNARMTYLRGMRCQRHQSQILVDEAIYLGVSTLSSRFHQRLDLRTFYLVNYTSKWVKAKATRHDDVKIFMISCGLTSFAGMVYPMRSLITKDRTCVIR